MIEFIRYLMKMLLMTLPFLLFALIQAKTNLKKPERSRQFPMPLVALIFGILALVFLRQINALVLALLNLLVNVLTQLGTWLSNLFNGSMGPVGRFIAGLGGRLEALLARVNLPFWTAFLANGLILLLFTVLKKILLAVFRRVFRTGSAVYETCARLCYDHDEHVSAWYVKRNFGQARTYLKTFYYASLTISVLALLLSGFLYRAKLLETPFYPVFGVLVIGELYFFLDGLTRRELLQEITGEEEEPTSVCNYSLLRKALRKLFGDKLAAEDTSATNALEDLQTNDELLAAYEASSDGMVEAYGRFMRARLEAGEELDRNYLASGCELLHGKSILFNNPFYYDLIPYAFYPMNRALLRHKKVLIVLGRHGTEDDILDWCEKGLCAVTNVPDLWKIGVLTENPQELDVGIVTRSSVHDLGLHEANADFFADVEFVVLIEPSRLVTTAQIGLNSLVRHCRRAGKQLTFCSTDKNCDGLVDALSHILMTSISEVSATNRFRGVCSYMCWEPDREHLQHRMLPNLSRYLGVGTELSFAALKNQVEKTAWYGGDAFPVVDMRWIVKQYYYDLLHYAGLPVSQSSIDEHFAVSHNLWNAAVEENQYLTIEDEAYNMFEVKRAFSTRATNQSFINVISPDYLLRDYMAENDSIFNADPKAIPYLVADYARTARNVVLRLCLRMSAGMVPEEELRRELMLIDADTEHLGESFWAQVCAVNQPVGKTLRGSKGEPLLRRELGGHSLTFTPETILEKRKFSMTLGKMQSLYYIADENFKRVLLGDLQNAGYIAEDENGKRQYLGTELRGQIFQKYLPGQFFTFNGKYYEMLSVASDGQVLVRRAADHIDGRPGYRQVRRYVLQNAADSEAMGDCRDIAGLRITKQYADFRVETPAYWQLDRYQDFAHGRLVTLNGVPARTYYNKQILRIDLPDDADETVCRTLTLLCNEVFRTLFAENQDYIVAVTAGEAEAPETYSLRGEGIEAERNSIYILEDSQMDLGLLVAVERNLTRIFSIICDYLDWHTGAIERSLNPPPEPEPVDYTVPEAEHPEEEAPKGRLKRLLWKIKRFFKRIGQAIAGFFAKLFGRKKKKTPAEPETPTDGMTPVEGGEAPEEPKQEPAAEAQKPGETAAEPEQTSETPKAEDAAADAEIKTEPETEAAEPAAEAPAEPEDSGEAPLQSLSSAAPIFRANEEDDIEFEPEETHRPGKPMERKPYHERFYLLYGGDAVPEQLDLAAAQEFLKTHGFADGALKQARDGKDIAEQIEKNYVPNKPGSHYCDFCGVELVGTEYEVLADGRERCMDCGRSSIRTAEEFEALYRTIARNMEALYGARISAPVHVQMVNSKRLHKKLGKTFVPTGKFDGRVLGVAIRDRDGYSILVENGAPRMSSTMTIAHELTHIWQYLHWDGKEILRKYGKEQELEIYEGMAKWAEIQYAYLIGEPAAAKREEISARVREDEYGRGFRKYVVKYPLSMGTHLEHTTPFDDPKTPL